MKYPDDMEARAFLALSTMGTNRYGAELMIREVLSKQPDHPGGHHYRIHNWDYHEPEQALRSARRYGEIAYGIGHALHMPGHIFSIVGMWNEAAIAMDAATRAEKQYMKDSLTFPFNRSADLCTGSDDPLGGATKHFGVTADLASGFGS